MVRRNYRAAAEQRAEEVRRHLQDLQGRHLQLTVRATLLALLLRIRREVAAHWRRCGGDPAQGQVLEERAEALARTGLLAAGIAGLVGRFEHLRPGASLLMLESVPLARVEAVRRMTLPDVAAAMTACHRRASGAAALLWSSRDAAPQRVAVASAIVSAMGRELQELHYLLMIWNTPVYHAFTIHRFDTLDPVVTAAADASLTHWDVVFRRLGLFREQALLLLDNGGLILQRVGLVQAERGTLMKDFIALDQQSPRHALGLAVLTSTAAAPHGGAQPSLHARGTGGSSPPQARSTGGGGGDDVGGCSGGGRADGAAVSWAPTSSSNVVTLEELVNSLEDNTTSEGAVRREGGMLALAVMTPLQTGSLLCACWPFPADMFQMLSSASYLLEHRPDELPWAGAPLPMGPRELWRLSLPRPQASSAE